MVSVVGRFLSDGYAQC